MTDTETILRLSEIEASRRRHVDALARLADEAAAIIATMMAGTGEATTPDAPEPAINRENLITVAQAAAEWKCSAKTMRKRADVYGAIRHVGGAVYVDGLAFIRGVNFQNLPKFSNAKKQKKPHCQISKTGKNA